MAELQLSIKIGNVDMNLQGEGELVYKIFKELRDGGLGVLSQKPISDDFADTSSGLGTEELNQDDTPAPEKKSQRTKKKGSPKQPQLVKNLDLSGKDVGKSSLKEFVTEKAPSTNIERTAVFIYYLQNTLELEDISIDYVFSCYKDVNARLPANLQQNLTDTASSRYGYIEVNSGKYTVTTIGSNLVEHDLPKGSS